MKKEWPNKKIAGISLVGKVERTEQEKVYIKLDIDGDGGKAIQPYSWEPVTGNMMYCMPQPGTKAWLYFPDCHEENAVAVSSMYTGNSNPGFEDIQKRVFATGQGKYMQLFDEGIYFRSEKGEARQQFSLGKEEFLLRAGMRKLVIVGKEGIALNAPNIKISTPQEINQYKSEGAAAQKQGEIHPRGSRNPATGGDAGFSMQYEFNGLAGQGILAGTEYERYWPFRDEPAYEKDCATWLKVLAGVATALLVGVVVGALVFATGGLAAVALGVTALQLGVCAGAVAAGVGVAAVASTWYHDKMNGTVSSLGDYVWNAFVASAEVGAAFVGICLSLYAADLLTLMVTGGLPLIPVGGSVITLGEIRLFAWLAASGISSRNLLYQLNDVGMFIFDEKPLRAPTGNERYDAEKSITEALTLQLGYLGMSNPYLYENAMSNMKGLFVMPTPNTELVVQNTTAMAPMDSGTAFATSGGLVFASQQMYSGMGAGNGGLFLGGNSGAIERRGNNFYTNQYGIIMDQTQYERYVINANGFGGVKGLSDFFCRIPANAQNIPWKPVPGGPKYGLKFRWVDAEGNLWNARAHSADPSAPPNSNASKGWVYRVEVRWGGKGKIYYMDGDGNYYPENVMRSTSPMYDSNVANDTHIPLN